MFTIGSFRRGAAVFFGLAAFSFTAFGANKAVATVAIPNGCRSGIVTTNGVAAGTIQLTYTYVGMTFPAGEFGCFDLTMAVADDTGSKAPAYPASLLIGQIGGQNVMLTPSSFTMTANGIALPVTGSPKHYTVAINPAVPNNPAWNEDGDTIVGNLQLSSSDNQLRTISNILVKILLVHPSTNCLKTYHEILDKETFGAVSSLQVNLQNGGPDKDKVNNSTPPGILDSVLVANTCNLDQSFDLLLKPSAYFEVQTAAPGNSLHVYTAAGEQNFASFATATGAGKGTNYCVSNLVVPSNTTLLTTAALRIRNKNSESPLAKSALPNGGNCSPWTAGCVFDFSAELRAAGYACSGGLVATPPISTNPLPKSLDFTVQ
jgi:hypothetical protein